MFAKWHLNRNPFYTRPIDKENIADFSGRSKEINELDKFLKLREGVIVLISEPGVGSTSIGNYSRFSSAQAYSTIHEFKIEKIEDGKDLLKVLIFGLLYDIKNNKISSKTAKPLIKEFSNKTDVAYNLKAPGIGGVNFKENKKQLPDNIVILTEIFNDLISEILKAMKNDFMIFQINNINIHSPEATNRIHNILEQMRDTFQTKKTMWYLLGDRVLEHLIKTKIPRLNSIVTNWMYIKPITSKDFKSIYQKRLKNSGDNAKSPFTVKAIEQLCVAGHGRIRMAFNIASHLIAQYADEIFPEIIDSPLVMVEAKNQIEKTIWRNLSPKTKEILKYVIKNPGSTSNAIATDTKISVGNLSKFLNPLINDRLIEKRHIGRFVKHYPIGLAEVIKI